MQKIKKLLHIKYLPRIPSVCASVGELCVSLFQHGGPDEAPPTPLSPPLRVVTAPPVVTHNRCFRLKCDRNLGVVHSRHSSGSSDVDFIGHRCFSLPDSLESQPGLAWPGSARPGPDFSSASLIHFFKRSCRLLGGKMDAV